MRVDPSKKIFIGLICAAVLMLFVCGFTYYNRATESAVVQKQLAEKKAALEDSEATARQLEVVEQKYADASAKLSVLEQGVSEQAYIPTLLRQLEELGKSVNLRVAGVRPKPKQVVAQQPSGDKAKDEAAKKDVKPYDELDIDIEIDGKYWDVVHFLREVTSFPKIIAVREVQISPVGTIEGKTSPKLAVKISTTAFILKQDAPIAKTGSRSEPADARI